MNAMNRRLGTTVHQEGDLRVVQLLEVVLGKETVVGFTVEGPDLQPLFIYPSLSDAIADLPLLAAGAPANAALRTQV